VSDVLGPDAGSGSSSNGDVKNLTLFAVLVVLSASILALGIRRAGRNV
jgi:hypothetical protein